MSVFDPAAPNDLRGDTVEDYHGTKVADPYRWLEDPDGADTVKWVEAQNKITDAYLSTLDTRDFLKEKLTAKYNYAKTGCSFKRGKGDLARYYYYKNDGLQNQYVLMSQATLDATPTVFFDPNLLAADGTKSTGATAFSKCGGYWAHGVSASGSDWQTVFIRDVKTGENTTDKVEWVKFSGISWLHDSSGFFYSRYPEPKGLSSEKDDVEGDDVKRGSETESNLNMAVYYHKLGSPQAEDVRVFAMPEQPTWLFGASVTTDGEYVMFTVSESTAPVNRVFWCKVSDVLAHVANGGGEACPVNKMIDNFEAGYDYITNEGSVFYFQTNRNAPRYKLITIDVEDPEEAKWKDVFPQKEAVLNDVLCVGGGKYLIACYMLHARETLDIYTSDGAFVQAVPLPDVGSVGSLAGRREDMEFFYSFMGFVHAGVKFRFDLADMASIKLREDVVVDHNPDDFETKQVFYESKDGTKIPMFLVGRKGQEHTGDTCTLLYGYGGFSISLTPSFSPFRTVFIKHFKGLLAIANIRGGGEYGEDWHEAGIKANKQNGFDDFQAAAEYLIKEKYTNPSKIAINGGSNGGFLVGACCNQRPDLYACAIPQVGVMDMLRFHKFTIGYAWIADYGSADASEPEFKNLHKLSPIHNVKPPAEGVQYPAILVTTGDHDDRVVPLHSFKYAATLQYNLKGVAAQKRPLLIRIETKAGHGAGKPTSKVIEEVRDIYAFIGASTNTECIRD